MGHGRGGRGRGRSIAAAAVVVNAAQLPIRGLSPATRAPAMLLTTTMLGMFHGLNVLARGSYNTGFSQGPRF
jgi:hypothetical protein